MSVGVGRTVGAAERRKAIIAATIGNFVEWYDFIIYGLFATTIATIFFPSEDRFTSLLATFAIFGVSFLVRPLGAPFKASPRAASLAGLPRSWSSMRRRGGAASTVAGRRSPRASP